MTDDEVRQVGDTVTVRGRNALDDLARCVLARIQKDRLNGASPARYARLLAAIHTAMSSSGQQLAESADPQTHSNQQGEDNWMSTTEAAATLGITCRQMRRLAPSIDGAQRIGNTWALRQAAVLALAEERHRKARNGQRQ
ncbi:hypothetical protein [Mycobacterium sp. SMC-4]|uniref:hypothetical protein n=1 Tax=Mycobacterium sp. SMC-4 TaxID=2857059 RepID=UPI003D03C85F